MRSREKRGVRAGAYIQNRILNCSNGDDEEDDAEGDGAGGHDLDEVVDLDVERALVLDGVEGGGGDVAEESSVACGIPAQMLQ